MLIEFNGCVGCVMNGLHCITNCPLKRQYKRVCDCCGEDVTLYKFDNQELCIDCIEESLEEIKE